jgi:hypothetical protein
MAAVKKPSRVFQESQVMFERGRPAALRPLAQKSLQVFWLAIQKIGVDRL